MHDHTVEVRRVRALEALPRLVAALQARGVHHVWLVGSLQWGGIHELSDIDLAVEGLPDGEVATAHAELLDLAPCPVDLIRLEEVPAAVAARIRSQGRLLSG
jgi:predicted nucleotidyltransferase